MSSRDRRSMNAVSLDSFSMGKKSTYDRRVKQQEKFVSNAKQLRTYKKLMKQEGYEAGQGGSRKRPREGTAAPVPEPEQKPEQEPEQEPEKKKKKSKKSNSFLFDPDEETFDLKKKTTRATKTKPKKEKKERISFKERKKMQPKTDPYFKAKQLAAVKQAEREKIEKEKVEKVGQSRAKIKQRKKAALSMGRRTSKGQVVLSSVINNMLDKIKKDM